ncbi:sulfurtransferase [Pseudokineococcus lusitanus]|uniref:Thiosulfate/3-mercaptopyruvate sulfurtransferase n=1 Tax=Pseudokineococcus lusitanus TaxID=763993 RepID=A0A3N1HSQ7_9ACTN|nr:sulfurtransferase [Pseudokineococcus lusitanus]ROP45541.1 thiosulfate/3-mercaptopyruvate sulfurtransferase [Pseudokineococcus lusitanus]
MDAPAALRAAHLVDASTLAALLAGDAPPVVLDVRWALGAPDGRATHRAARVPGSTYVDLETELAGHGAPTDGRHPLPDVADLQAAARRWGVGAGQAVVVLDDVAGLSAARAWWLLRWAGLADVRLLDGGLAAWRAAGLPLASSDPVAPAPGDVVLRGGALPTVDADGAAALASRGRLLDVRAGERYRGETEPVDPRAGHVPGALSAPTAETLDAAGALVPSTTLDERFAALGTAPGERVGVSCGSGVTAAHAALTLVLSGREPVLFPGSWSAWANDPARPVAVGAEPWGSDGPTSA